MTMMDWRVEHFDVLASTQNSLKLRVDEDEGLVLCAGVQSGGHGRHGRVWESPPGNLYFSFLVKPECKVVAVGQLSLLVGLALHRVLAGFTSEALILKWPNDVLMGAARRKCAGILIDCELAGEDVRSCVVGIGVNICDAPEYGAALGADVKADDVLARFLAVFDALYVSWWQEGFEAHRRAWLEAAHEKGAPLTVKIGKRLESGVFHDIDALGNAIIEKEDGSRQVISSGEVFLG